jgi:hypothetical protein
MHPGGLPQAISLGLWRTSQNLRALPYPDLVACFESGWNVEVWIGVAVVGSLWLTFQNLLGGAAQTILGLWCNSPQHTVSQVEAHLSNVFYVSPEAVCRWSLPYSSCLGAHSYIFLEHGIHSWRSLLYTGTQYIAKNEPWQDHVLHWKWDLNFVSINSEEMKNTLQWAGCNN